MQTVTRQHRGLPKCYHRWETLGAHTLHAGTKPYYGSEKPIREVRTVKRCRKCNEIKVNVSTHCVLGVCYTTPGAVQRSPELLSHRKTATVEALTVVCETITAAEIQEVAARMEKDAMKPDEDGHYLFPIHPNSGLLREKG